MSLFPHPGFPKVEVPADYNWVVFIGGHIPSEICLLVSGVPETISGYNYGHIMVSGGSKAETALAIMEKLVLKKCSFIAIISDAGMVKRYVYSHKAGLLSFLIDPGTGDDISLNSNTAPKPDEIMVLPPAVIPSRWMHYQQSEDGSSAWPRISRKRNKGPKHCSIVTG